MLRQSRNTLAHAGFLQAQKRPGRPEADITLLAPSLETSWGHPAIWEKLLSHYAHEAARLQIARLYADVPDQPLLVNTFSQVGFKPYTRQTIWRLTHINRTLQALPESRTRAITIRPQQKADEWNMRRLYERVTPLPVQHSEGVAHQDAGQSVKPLILDWWQSGSHQTYVLEQNGEIEGCILLGFGARGYWMRMLVDTLNPDVECMSSLLQFGLRVIHEINLSRRPIYVGVRDYHGGMAALLSEFGFAPFTDRARMVRHVHAWAREPIFQRLPVLEKAVGKAIPTTYTFPRQPQTSSKVASFVSQSQRQTFMLDSLNQKVVCPTAPLVQTHSEVAMSLKY
ncbi:MAG: hypothetical protein R3A44_21085 [Caldilineaceae bacterium]